MLKDKIKKSRVASTAVFMRPGLASLLTLALVVFSGCSPKDRQDADSVAADRTETINIGQTEVTLTVSPGEVYLDRDNILTMRAESPQKTEVKFPPIEDRLAGFTPDGSFDSEPAVEDNHRIIERVIRLKPNVSEEYRIAPMAVTVIDNSTVPPLKSWGATPPIKLDLHAVTDKSVGGDIAENLKPVWIRPSIHTLAGYFVLLILAAFAAWVLLRLGKRVQRQVRLMRMSPRERALEELRELLNKGLLEKHKIKDFYVELTMVVRRYIERQHKVRAPEQTTEEFLQQISQDGRFKPEVIKKLRDFLQAADMVKFAAYQPDEQMNQKSIRTAEEYIRTDAEEAEEQNAKKDGGR